MRLAQLLFAGLAALAIAHAQQYRAFWADAFHYGYKTPAEVDRLLDDVTVARANAIFVQVRRRADSYYLRTLEVPAQDATYAPGFDALADLIGKAHARGIEVHAWFVVYPLWPSTIAPPLNPSHVWHKHGPRATGADMWMQVNAQGQTLSAFDPGHPGVVRYLSEVITDPLNHYDLDGVHLDYARYDESGNYGGNPKSLERFQRQELRGVTRPAANDAAWADFRRRQVTALVRQVYLRSIARKPAVKVSAALISWGNGPLNDAGFRSTDAYATVFQDWRAWLEEGILDLAMPMHYFRDAANAAFLDRWTEFAKSRQYRRGYLPGLAPYLNPIADSLNQTRRVLAQSPVGVTFYSYASTNTLDAAGLPVVSNAEFYRQAGELFARDARPPELPWKVSPEFGHAMGVLDVAGGPEWLADGAAVTLSSDTGQDFARTGAADGTGFFGFVDLPPDRYRLRVERGGRLVAQAAPQDVKAGAVTRFEFRLRAADFDGAAPRLSQVAPDAAAAPGDVVALTGVNLTAASVTEAYAPGVPLPAALGGAQVLVNGVAVAPLFSAAPGRLVVQLPYLDASAAGEWSIVARQGGMESAAVRLSAAPVRPRIATAIRRDGYLEIYAYGLGMVEPALAAGSGADPGAPLPRVRASVVALIDGVAREPSYAGLAPFQPGLYQVNVPLAAGAPASGTVRLSVGGAISEAAVF